MCYFVVIVYVAPLSEFDVGFPLLAQHLLWLWLHCLYCVAVLPMMLVVLAGVWDSPAAVCFSADGSMERAQLT